jgi:DNA-directed RNA polymerase subunit RPC12/RpoP
MNHQYSFDIACPACGSKGVAAVVEDAGPPFEDAPRRTYRSPDDKFKFQSGTPPTVVCVTCGKRFRHPDYW